MSLSHSKSSVFAAHYAIVGGIMLLPLASTQLEGATERLDVLCWIAIGLFAWGSYSWKRCAGTVFDAYGLFWLVAFLFNAGQLLLEPFGLNRHGILDGTLPLAVVVNAAYFVLLSLAVMHLAALWQACKRAAPIPGLEADPRVMRLFGLGLIVLAAPAAAMVFFDALRAVLAGGYLALYQRHISAGVESLPAHLSLLLIPGGLLLMAGHEGRRWAAYGGVGVIATWSLANMMLGGRGLPGFVLLAAALCWHRSVKPLPKAPILVAGVAVFVLAFPIIAVVRNMAGDQRDQALQIALERGALDNPAVSLVAEMGTTMQTVAHTQRLVPAERPFDLGQTYGYAALAIVPNVFWDVHPTSGRGVPSTWLVWTIFPEFASIGGGLGYSFIAEAYLNFGWLGAVLVMPLLGSGIAWIALRTHDRSRPLSIAAGACFTAFVLFYARADSTEIVRRQTWYVLFPAAACVVLSRWSSVPQKLPERRTA